MDPLYEAEAPAAVGLCEIGTHRINYELRGSCAADKGKIVILSGFGLKCKFCYEFADKLSRRAQVCCQSSGQVGLPYDQRLDRSGKGIPWVLLSGFVSCYLHSAGKCTPEKLTSCTLYL